MGNSKSNQNISTRLSNATPTATATTPPDVTLPKRRIAQSFVLIWMNVDVDQSSEECQNTLTQLRSVIGNLHIFNQTDECIDFLTDVCEEKAFLILDGTIAQETLPLIYDIPKLGAIYIFCQNKSIHEQWTKEWTQVQGVYTEIAPICEPLQQVMKQTNQDSIAVSFVPINEGTIAPNLDQLEPTFMYTQIFREILLGMEYNQQSVEDFTTYCRDGNNGSMKNIDRFKNEYCENSAIWWYTFPSFIYDMLNTALRTMKGETMIKMGFFISDLHHEIEKLHRQQVGSYHGKLFTVYRGQGLSITDFEKLLKTKGGLIAFNNFLSTSKDRENSFHFAETALTKAGAVGILFQILIDPSVLSTPFASIQEKSYYHTEEEVLFSMHTVFRIGEISRVENDHELYQVHLKLTADDDQELRLLTNQIRGEIHGDTDWERLGTLLARIGHFAKAKELYTILLQQSSDELKAAHGHNNIGFVTHQRGDYNEALSHFEKALEIRQKTLPSNHPDLATSYNNIAFAYESKGEYWKAF